MTGQIGTRYACLTDDTPRETGPVLSGVSLSFHHSVELLKMKTRTLGTVVLFLNPGIFPTDLKLPTNYDVILNGAHRSQRLPIIPVRSEYKSRKSDTPL